MAVAACRLGLGFRANLRFVRIVLTPPPANGGFVEEIAAALKRSLGDSWVGVKTVAAWTGASEKTVKNWFSGTYGPSGTHLIALSQHSDEVLDTFPAMAGRNELMVAVKLAAAEQTVEELLEAV